MALTVAEKSCAFGSTTWVVAALTPLATDRRWTSAARPLPYSLLSLMNATLLGFTVCDRYDAMEDRLGRDDGRQLHVGGRRADEHEAGVLVQRDEGLGLAREGGTDGADD